MGQTSGFFKVPLLVPLMAIALALIAAGAVWSERITLVRWVALRAIDRLELGPASLVVNDLNLDGFHAHNVSLRGGALHIDTVSAAFNPLALIARHIARVDITGLDLAAVVGPDGLSLGGKPVGGAGGGALPDWRIDDVVLSDAHVAVATANLQMKATLSTHLALGDGAISASDIASEITIPVAGTPRTLHLTARSLTAAPHLTGLPLLSLTQASITSENPPWRASGIGITLSSSTDRLAAVANLAELTSLQQPPIVAPLRLSGEANLAGGNAEITFKASTVARSPFSLEATGRYEVGQASGLVVLTMAPLDFAQHGFQPGDLVPALAELAGNVTGSVGLTGSIAWHDRALAPNLLLRLDNLSGAFAAAQIRALSGAIRITNVWPPTTAPHQALSAVIEAPGIPAAKLSLRGQLTAKPALAVEELAANIAGGEITITPVTVDPSALALDTTLRVSHIDLAALTTLLGIDGLSGTGALDGDIPLAFANHKLTIRTGKLAAKGSGVLRYQPSHLPPQIAAAGESVDLALKVLNDFRYDRLSLELDKSADGEGAVLLHMEGNNPAVMSGRTFTFNIRVESNFDRLADYALLSLRSAQDLLHHAAGRSGP